MATTKNVTKTPSGRIKYRGETFAGYNKPKNETPGANKKKCGSGKKRVRDQVGTILAIRLCRLKKISPKKVERVLVAPVYKCDTAKDKFSARYWSCKCVVRIG